MRVQRQFGESFLATFDRNRDGAVDDKELHVAWRQRFDRNADGRVTGTEVDRTVAATPGLLKEKEDILNSHSAHNIVHGAAERARSRDAFTAKIFEVSSRVTGGFVVAAVVTGGIGHMAGATAVAAVCAPIAVVGLMFTTFLLGIWAMFSLVSRQPPDVHPEFEKLAQRACVGAWAAYTDKAPMLQPPTATGVSMRAQKT